MRLFLLILCCISIPLAANAIEPPPGQVQLDAHQILRGHFVQAHQIDAAQAPLESVGHFTVAPEHGLIWGMEQPFPTATIITPDKAGQALGGMVVKLPIKNLRHLYEMIGGALSGNWNKLAEDFTITPSGNAKHWQMLLTPHTTDKPSLPYAAITVTGSRFVESIVMTKRDGSSDSFTFSNVVLASAQLNPEENMQFAQMGQ